MSRLRALGQRLPALVASAALMLSACGTLNGEPGAAENGAEASATAAPARKAAFDIRVECEDSSLRTLVERHNELQLYRSIGDLDPVEQERLLVQAEHDVRNLLGTRGYFSPAVEVWQEDGGTRPTVVIRIEPGTPTLVSEVNIGFEGDIAQNPDATEQRESIVEHWGLDAGDHFTQEGWSGAKTGALRRLIQQRYPMGQLSYSVADIDAASAEARLHVRMESGPLYQLGPARVRGAERYPPELAERLSWLKPGDEYDQQELQDAQQRLASSGYYDSAFISVDTEGDPAAAPVRYFVREAKQKKLQLGVGFSTDGGPRASLEHRNNKFLDSNWRSDTKLHLERKEPLLQFQLSSLPNANGWYRGMLARYMRQDDGILNTLSQTLSFGILKNTRNYDRNLYLQFDRATVSGSGDRQVPNALLGDGAALSVNYAWTGRYFDSLPVPSRGYGLSLDIGAGMTMVGKKRPFARLTGRWVGVLPTGDSGSRLQFRTEMGSILSSKGARIPSTYMFRTGGDKTVRGYPYRRIGVDVGEDLIGPGRYMALGSVEWQRPIFQDRMPGLLEHVTFIDVGNVANRVQDFTAHWGVGTGLRLITPVGPMQLDVAYGLKPKRVRLHMSVGFYF